MDQSVENNMNIVIKKSEPDNKISMNRASYADVVRRNNKCLSEVERMGNIDAKHAHERQQRNTH